MQLKRATWSLKAGVELLWEDNFPFRLATLKAVFQESWSNESRKESIKETKKNEG